MSAIITSGNTLDTFTRLKLGHIYVTEELRYDRPVSYVNSFSYCGVAIAGSATSDLVWNVTRVTYNANQRATREQYRANISWDNRTVGWS